MAHLYHSKKESGVMKMKYLGEVRTMASGWDGL